MLRKIWSLFLSGKVEDYSLADHLQGHLDQVVEERNRYLAAKYERERVQNENDFNIVNETRERMKAINQRRNAR